MIAFIFSLIPHIILLIVCGLAYEIEVPAYHNVIFILCIFTYMVIYCLIQSMKDYPSSQRS